MYTNFVIELALRLSGEVVYVRNVHLILTSVLLTVKQNQPHFPLFKKANLVLIDFMFDLKKTKFV